MPKLCSCQGLRGTLANAVVGHLHDPRCQGTKTLLHGHPRWRHPTDDDDCCVVKVVEVAPIFYQQSSGDAGVVIGILAKEDHLRWTRSSLARCNSIVCRTRSSLARRNSTTLTYMVFSCSSMPKKVIRKPYN